MIDLLNRIFFISTFLISLRQEKTDIYLFHNNFFIKDFNANEVTDKDLAPGETRPHGQIHFRFPDFTDFIYCPSSVELCRIRLSLKHRNSGEQ